ncbi:MAG: hypothetical protein RJQ09_11530 [Cyclobacteriaceae bacterium]
MRNLLLLLPFFISVINLAGAQNIIEHFDASTPDYTLEELRKKFPNQIKKSGSELEHATLIALHYYPKLRTNKIKIKHKKNVKHPITASYSFWNAFKIRRWHKYVLLIKKGSFVDGLDLNAKVGLIGHEMAHFEYYKNRPAICMIPWGIRYVVSRKFRYSFERDADKTTIEKGLGWQLMQIAFYTSREKIRELMNENPIYAK